jgi:hypothetical protein
MTLAAAIVEVGFTVGASTGTLLHLDDPARGKLDTATLAPDSTWTDITADVRSVETTRGATRVVGSVIRYEAGTATITLYDNSRNYDPSNLAGPYVSGGVTQVTPMRAVRIRALHNGTYYDLWRGFADSWVYDYPAPGQTVCVLKATDGFKVLGAFDRVAVAGVGASEDIGARISRVLTSAAWSATDRVIATGDSTAQITTLAGNALAECQTAADSEIGEFYMDPAGRAFFRNRTATMTDARSNTAQGTFTDAADGGLPYHDVTTSYDDDHLINLVTGTRTGGAQQTSTHDASASVASYLTHTYDNSSLILESDSVVLDWANMICYQNKDPELRFETIELVRNHVSATEDLLFAQMLGRLIGDRITISHRPAGGGTIISRDVFVRGIAHQISEGGTVWRTIFQLQSAAKYSFLVLDNATLGKLNSNAPSA